MDGFSYFIIGCIFMLLALYVLFEVHYFLRMCLCVFLARFVKRRCHILDTTTVNGVCLTNDIDTLLYHMNNARYLRELDFARVDFYERTNLYRTIIAKGGSVFQGAATIRYRRFIRPFHRFQILSRIIYWDDQSIFMEHRFVQPSDQFVHCIAICRQRLVNVPVDVIMSDLLAPLTTTTMTPMAPPRPAPIQASQHTISSTVSLENGMVTTNVDQVEPEGAQALADKLKPDMPLELMKWIEYNDVSSKNLRKGC